MLWIANKSLKTKGYGIIVLTSLYFPDIEESTEVYIEEDETINLAGNSLDDPTPMVRTAAEYSVPISVLIGTPAASTKPSWQQKISNRMAIKSLIRRKKEALPAQIATLPLYELIARGWDATTERWRVPVYPTLDSSLAQTPGKSKVHIWDAEVVEVPGNPQQDDLGPAPLVPGNEIVINVESAGESDEAPAFTDPGTPSFGASSTEGSFPEGSTPVSEFAATSFTTIETHALGGLLATEAGPSKLEDAAELQ
ncbi:hypothetical protein B0H17DRAFT_1132060 [Mycena rosella]|uniref:Uncharacterized protein n=1 Tax=Mycena rosella TaxID=1033263 RepID=A0AAD7GLB7_MYCRO|nr:hypothetical protein B0H17DRAFT_1132060 [Mycena rosella]